MLSKPAAVCKNCEKRNPGCHSICADYISFKEQLDNYNKKVKQNRNAYADWSDYTRKRLCRR